MVKRSFTIEFMGISEKPRRNADDLRALEHLEQTAKLIDGQWHVGCPPESETPTSTGRGPSTCAVFVSRPERR
ncbi:unnamed protein product, partial [Brenthis ino]